MAGIVGSLTALWFTEVGTAIIQVLMASWFLWFIIICIDLILVIVFYL